MLDTPKETVSVKQSLSLLTTRRHLWATEVKPAQKSFKYIKFYVQEQFATPKQVANFKEKFHVGISNQILEKSVVSIAGLLRIMTSKLSVTLKITGPKLIADIFVGQTNRVNTNYGGKITLGRPPKPQRPSQSQE